MLGNLRLQPHRICNTNCFLTAIMVTRKRLNVILYVLCMSCYIVTAAVKLLAASNQLSEPYEFSRYFVKHFLTAVQQRTLSYLRLKFLPPRRHIKFPLKKGLMLYREANRVDRENLMQLFIHSVDNRRSFYVLQHVVHTISYDEALYCSKCIRD